MLRFPVMTSAIRQRCYWIGSLLFAALILVQLLPWRTHFSLAKENNSVSNTNINAMGDICIVAPITPFDPKWGIALHAPRSIPIDARCPVCGMFPSRSREWAAQVIFNNGDTHFFDSPLSLFLYLHNVEQYSNGRHAENIAVSYVSSVSSVNSVNKNNLDNSANWIKAEEASYVSGSNALGPMRAGNLPAFSSVAAAEEFAKKRGGVVINSRQITPQLLQQLHGARSHKHHEMNHDVKKEAPKIMDKNADENKVK